MAGRACIASVRQREQSRSVFGDGPEASHPSGEEIAVAVKEKNERLALLRRDVPSDHPLAVGGIEHDLLRRWKSGCGRCCSHRLRHRVEQVTLHGVKERTRTDIECERAAQRPFQCGHRPS